MKRQNIHAISGIAPVILSLAAFLLVIVSVMTGWGQRAGDEGAAAHLFQLLILGQIPFFLAFLATADWVRKGSLAFPVACQVLALIAAFLPVLYFRL